MNALVAPVNMADVNGDFTEEGRAWYEAEKKADDERKARKRKPYAL